MSPDSTDPKIDLSPVEIPDELLIVPLKDWVVFPYMVVPLFVNKEGLVQELSKAAESGSKFIGLVTKKDQKKPVPPVDNLYEIGTVAKIVQYSKIGDKEINLLVQGIKRIKIKRYTAIEPVMLKAKVEPVKEKYTKGKDVDKLAEDLKNLFKEYVAKGKIVPIEVVEDIMKIDDNAKLSDILVTYMNLEISERQELLNSVDVFERMKKVYKFLKKNISLIDIKSKTYSNVAKEIDKSEKDFILRKELETIKKELGETEEENDDVMEFKKRINEAEMPDEVRKIAEKELKRLSKIHPISPEYTVARDYIDWLVSMPWSKGTKSDIDIQKAKRILDKDHYGLEKIKQRILEYLAVSHLKKGAPVTVMCFVGPPGTGKTSLGQSIARALNRKFIHFSLGGIRDEAEIRGHRRTYVGALPGRIIQRIKRVGINNPVCMLDEIDKVGKDFRGDPSSALLEALDPEQNFAFTDHYLDVPFDLSKVLFILTANITDTIPPALLDRMEVMFLEGYNEQEKLLIAKKYLIPKQLEAKGLKKNQVHLSDSALLKIIRDYTREAGVRELERTIGVVFGKVAMKIVEKGVKKANVTSQTLARYLGVERFFYDVKQARDTVGVATGLAWTESGGDVIFVEATKMEGNKRLILTGNLGDVMRESAKAALSFVRSNAKKFGIQPDFYENSDIHIHVPAGAIPKDGPSAGVTLATTLVSLLTGRKVRRDVAMTGEITLRGKVLAIGGLKSKILAAQRAGVKTVIIPEQNSKNLEEIPPRFKKGLKFILAKKIDDAIEVALLPKDEKK